jgi:hypothetical protein
MHFHWRGLFDANASNEPEPESQLKSISRIGNSERLTNEALQPAPT